ncbi:MAG: MBL fold metallo-hydrolase [Clostridia bacterium]|nr:MBL fold metallo-hydrolase [Clostridia bacterium]
MKKYALRLIALLTAVMILLPVNVHASSLLAGDIDNDGSVTASDARLALRYSVGLEEFDDQQQLISDVDFSNKTDASDARTILRMAVGLEKNFYIEEEKEEESFFEAHFIDVGQADCALIICDGETLLIDAGNVPDGELIVSYLKEQSIEELDYVISTHAHEDHVGGLGEVLSEFTVTNTVFAPEKGADTDCYRDFLSAVTAQELTLTVPEAGSELSFGSSTLTFITPLSEAVPGTNNTSLVAKIEYGETSFLFTGDIERDAEAGILETGRDISADVLKIAHHGGATSTTYPFLREVMPEIAIISVGNDNSYGHPTEEVLSKLRDAEVTVYRTDMQGHIVIKSDGQNLTVTTEKNQDAETNPTIPSVPDTPDIPDIPEAPDDQTPEEYGEFIGNINSKKLHTPTCSSLPKEENRIYFASVDSAISEGYTACSRCKPF